MNEPTLFDRIGFSFRKPEYLFQPVRLLRRRMGTNDDSIREVALPWGGEIQVKKSDVIGNAIVRHGVYELAVSEVLWRLLREDDSFLDVGANIGYMSHLMASRTKRGTGMSFEPHPLVFSRLSMNLGGFSSRVKLFPSAVGKQQGRLQLIEPDSFDENEGTARLRADGDSGSGIEVDVLKLDDVLLLDEQVRVMKVDVEGGELDVFKGAVRSLENHSIQHIVYEDFAEFPSQCINFLNQLGYKVYRLTKGLWGPILWDPEARGARNIDLPWEPTNYVATINEDELRRVMKPRGWQALRG